MDIYQKIAAAPTVKEAVKIYSDELLKYKPRIDATKKKWRESYDGKTLKTPYIEFPITDTYPVIEAGWVRDDPFALSLNNSMQGQLKHLEIYDKFDYVPSVGLLGKGDSSYIACLLGSKIKRLGADGVIVEKPAIESAADVDQLIMPDMDHEFYLMQMINHVKYLMENYFFDPVVEDLVDIAYPGVQGPSTNSLRVMLQEDGLMDMLVYPEEMEKLALMITKIMITVFKQLFAAAGSDKYFRTRPIYYQDRSIRGLMVDDWISIVSPETYYQVYKSSWELMHKEMGGNTYLHTCGPVLQQAELLTKLPGLTVFESCFIRNQHKTIADLFEMKRLLGGKVMFQSNGMPTPWGAIAEDGEKMTREVLDKLFEGGKFAIYAYGSEEYARQLVRQLEL